MSLKWYRRPRMVALNANTPVLEAARAIESNNIGGVVVQNKGRVVGLATDRDLTVRVVGQGLDSKTTPLSAVMTSPVLTLSPADSQRDAIRLMQERKIRRVPLVEGERLVGMVTLDDLLLDEAAPLEELAAVVVGQLGEGGPAPSDRTPSARRSAGGGHLRAPAQSITRGFRFRGGGRGDRSQGGSQWTRAEAHGR